jgi:hypothetical protein
MSNIISSAALLNVIQPEKKNNGAEFTITSKKSGKEYTYKISRKEFKGKWYTHIKVEQQYQKFTYLGTYFKGKIYHKGALKTTPSALAIAHILLGVESGFISKLDNLMELRHTGKCLRCSRPLTDSNSIDIGLGPVCANL